MHTTKTVILPHDTVAQQQLRKRPGCCTWIAGAMFFLVCKALIALSIEAAVQLYKKMTIILFGILVAASFAMEGLLIMTWCPSIAHGWLSLFYTGGAIIPIAIISVNDFIGKHETAEYKWESMRARNWAIVFCSIMGAWGLCLIVRVCYGFVQWGRFKREEEIAAADVELVKVRK
ncbi:hypothetical protein BJ508DRAFT_321132 [Ascobolus immersus RN42]|uniref:Uncharacterized protein n=1 Tax=Ascobolus immersus RN42 TaxID=1160509 RepID=A0A3N4IM99_ASCIM|nr:hypothetical protein BJ508DRAFT_321132 [Ascobolus immersus RN42]